MKLSQRGEYALRALLVLGMNHGPEVVRIKEIAQQQNIPRRFLEQILNYLKSAALCRADAVSPGGIDCNDRRRRFRWPISFVILRGRLRRWGV
jgi:Rrf2 family protein